MCHLKLCIAVMLSVAVMQLHGAASASTTDAAVSRTSSKELLERMSEESMRKASLPQFQLAQSIENFQRSEYVVGIRTATSLSCKNPKIVFGNLFSVLVACRKQLEENQEGLVVVDVAQTAYNHLQVYRDHPSKVTPVVTSSQFLQVEKVCRSILIRDLVEKSDSI